MKMLLTECLSCDTITCMRVHVRERISHDFACWQEEWSRKMERKEQEDLEWKDQCG